MTEIGRLRIVEICRDLGDRKMRHKIDWTDL
jgi:hypothetical protein